MSYHGARIRKRHFEHLPDPGKRSSNIKVTSFIVLIVPFPKVLLLPLWGLPCVGGDRRLQTEIDRSGDLRFPLFNACVCQAGYLSLFRVMINPRKIRIGRSLRSRRTTPTTWDSISFQNSLRSSSLPTPHPHEEYLKVLFA